MLLASSFSHDVKDDTLGGAQVNEEDAATSGKGERKLGVVNLEVSAQYINETTACGIRGKGDGFPVSCEPWCLDSETSLGTAMRTVVGRDAISADPYQRHHAAVYVGKSTAVLAIRGRNKL